MHVITSIDVIDNTRSRQQAKGHGLSLEAFPVWQYLHTSKYNVRENIFLLCYNGSNIISCKKYFSLNG